MTYVIIILTVLAVAGLVVVLYDCKKSVEQRVLNVEACTLNDKEYMIQNYGRDFKWFETNIDLKDYLDEDGGEVESITNIFQTLIDGDPLVVIFTHTEAEDKVEKIHSFWVEDFQMEGVDVTYQQALEAVNRVNLPKPHSKHCVLRKQVGPKPCNPQYIFGNQTAQLYVDAITGKVTDKNPAFNE